MVKVKENLVGKQFDRLTVIEQVEDYIEPKSGIHHARWLCECSCEEHNRVIIIGKDLKRKKRPTRSCGCLAKEHCSKVGLSLHKTNIYDLINNDYGIGITYNTNKEFYFDLEDYDKIKNYCWYEFKYKNCNYTSLIASIDNKKIKMHQLLGFNNYDHKNRNTLDNRKENLRPCTIYENNRNRGISKRNKSGIIGVCFDNRSMKWRSYININNKQQTLGIFDDKNDAIISRLKAEQKHYGEFAPQKHLFEQYGIIED